MLSAYGSGLSTEYNLLDLPQRQTTVEGTVVDYKYAFDDGYVSSPGKRQGCGVRDWVCPAEEQFLPVRRPDPNSGKNYSGTMLLMTHYF